MCTKCHRKSDYSRGLCHACFIEQVEDSSHRSYASTEYFIQCCKNGIVKELLEHGLRYEDLCEKFEISHGSIQKYVKMFDLHQFSRYRKYIPHKYKEQSQLNLTDAQKLALCTPWVKNETSRYYLPV